MNSRDFKPLIVIGAARSGTKLLRDVVAKHPEINKVPYDVNYIWRLGNHGIRHDELLPQQCTPKIKSKIRHQLEKYHTGCPVLIEKTVSNCLRIPFIDAVYPNAYYIHLIRDGYDVVESVHRQWTASPDWRYMLQKACTFPIASAPSYAFKYSLAIASKMLRNREKPKSTWGPIYDGIEQDLQTLSLLEVCAIQWRKCVKQASETLALMPDDRVFTIRYADFVASPIVALKSVAEFIEVSSLPYQNMDFSNIERGNIGKSRNLLTTQQLETIAPYIEPTLDKLNKYPLLNLQ